VRRVRVTTTAVEKQSVLRILITCLQPFFFNPARRAHAPYCHLCPVRLYPIFPHYIINGTSYGEISWKWNVRFDFVVYSVFPKHIFHSKKNRARHFHKCTVGNRTRRRTGGLQQKITQYARGWLYREKWTADDELTESSKHVEWMTTTPEIKGSP